MLCLPRRTEPKQLSGEAEPDTQALVDEFEERARQFAWICVSRPDSNWGLAI